MHWTMKLGMQSIPGFHQRTSMTEPEVTKHIPSHLTPSISQCWRVKRKCVGLSSKQCQIFRKQTFSSFLGFLFDTTCSVVLLVHPMRTCACTHRHTHKHTYNSHLVHKLPLLFLFWCSSHNQVGTRGFSWQCSGEPCSAEEQNCASWMTLPIT